jgi:hypothetical protein
LNVLSHLIAKQTSEVLYFEQISVLEGIFTSVFKQGDENSIV